jgi:hypothetical protein
MIEKPRMPPSTQRRFANGWGELDYLCEKIHYWLHVRKQTAAAQRYKDRLTKVLSELPASNIAIIRAEGLALLSEMKGEVAAAIVHRRREIHLMERLHKEAESATESTRKFMLRTRSARDLRERRIILEALRKKHAQLRKRFPVSSSSVPLSS